MAGWLDLAASGVNALGGMLQSHWNNATARRNTDRTNAANMEQARFAFDKNVQMWNLQNDYNSPAKQMERFKAAGLNPNLIYGQGTAGNASSPVQYNPPDVQYKYQAPNYGAVIQSIIPTLMEVGSWMQDMRLKEMQVKGAEANLGTTGLRQMQLKQLIDYLEQKNPAELRKLENNLSLYPYQSQMQASLTEAARVKLWELGQKFRSDYGQDLWSDLGSPGSNAPIGGLKKLEFLRESAKNVGLGFQNKLLGAKSSFTEFNLTDPQALMQMVLGGVMSMAGQQLRISGAGKGSFNQKRRYTSEVEERLRNGRTKIRRTIRE